VLELPARYERDAQHASPIRNCFGGSGSPRKRPLNPRPDVVDSTSRPGLERRAPRAGPGRLHLVSWPGAPSAGRGRLHLVSWPGAPRAPRGTWSTPPRVLAWSAQRGTWSTLPRVVAWSAARPARPSLNFSAQPGEDAGHPAWRCVRQHSPAVDQLLRRLCR